MVAGVVVLAVPWLLLLVGMILQFIGPHWEKLRSNASIISSITSDGIPSWQGTELERRLQSGRLSNMEAANAVDQFILYAKSRPEWSGFIFSFFQAAVDNGAVSNAQYLRFAQELFGKTPKVRVQFDFATAGVPLDAYVDFDRSWPLWNSRRVITIRGIYLSDLGGAPTVSSDTRTSGATTSKVVLQNNGNAWMVPSDLPGGKCRATFQIDVTILPMRGPSGLSSLAPAALAQWTETITVPIQIQPDPYGGDAARLWASRAKPPYAAMSIQLADGKTIQLRGICRPARWPFCWWSTDGRPLPLWNIGAQNLHDCLWVDLVVFGGHVLENPIASPPVYSGGAHSEMLEESPDATQFTVGVPSGDWIEVGRLKLSQPKMLEGTQCEAHYMAGTAKEICVDLRLTGILDDQFNLIAVSKTGQEIQVRDDPNWNSLKAGRDPKARTWSKFLWFSTQLEDVDYFRLMRRRRQFVNFTGFATNPSVPPYAIATTQKSAPAPMPVNASP